LTVIHERVNNIASMNILGNQIRDARRKRGLTLAQLAARTGIDQGLLSKYERGEVMPIKNRERLFSFLQLSKLTIITEREHVGN
jgi:transcriptional regulator with XRE-family HTH domain